MIRLVGNGLVVATTVLAWAFCVLYHFLAPWWRTQIGRQMMTYSLIVALVLSLSMARLAFGAGLETTWFQVVRLVVFAGVPVAIAWRIVILLRIQRRGVAERER